MALYSDGWPQTINRIQRAKDIQCRRHIVHPDDACTALPGCDSQRKTAWKPILGSPAQQVAQHALSGQANQNRKTRRHEHIQPAQQGEIVLEVFAKSETRIEYKAIARQSCRHACSGSPQEKIPHLHHHIDIAGLKLHGLRFALHVHQAYRNPGRHSSRQRTWPAQRADIIDHPGTCGDGGPHHFGASGIDGNRNVAVLAKLIDDWNHPLKLLACTGNRGAGPRGLTANVQYVSAFSNELQPMRDSRISPTVATTVPE